ncbi:hypothetical protein D4S03_01650 [bacterium]|nr:MAG: hypothetical protein D4S03_01650 [bacterium]
MSDWKQKCAKKILSAADVLKRVKDGDRAVVARAPELKGVEVVHMVSMRNSDSHLRMRGQMCASASHQEPCPEMDSCRWVDG